MKLLTYDPGTGTPLRRPRRRRRGGRCRPFGVCPAAAGCSRAAGVGRLPRGPGRRRLGRQRSRAEGGAGRRSPAFSRAPTAHDPGLHRLRRTRHVPRDPGDRRGVVPHARLLLLQSLGRLRTGGFGALPLGFDQLDYELEIGCVVGRGGTDVPASEGLQYIAGFCIFNDWSARDLQFDEMTFGLGPAKGKDSAQSLGPWVVTTDEIASNIKDGRWT